MAQTTGPTSLLSPRQLHRLRAKNFLVLFALMLAACSTDSCSCDGFEQRPFPAEHYDKTVPMTGQLRLTPYALAFLESEVPNLIEHVVPGGLSFCIPESTDGDAEFCMGQTCSDGSPGCQIDLQIENTDLVPTPPNQLVVNLTIGDIDETVPIKYRVPVIGTLDCDVQLHKRGSQSTPATVTGTIPVTFNVDANSPTRDLRIEIGEIALDLEELDFRLSGDWRCSTASALRSFFRGMIERQIDDALGGIVGDMTREQLCRPCGGGEPACPGNATCQNVEGSQICVYNATAQCVPRTLGVEGRLGLGALLDGYTQSPQAAVDVMVRAADHASVNTGVSLGMRTGFQPTALERCAPVDPTTRPSFDPIPLSTTINGARRPHNNEPFMVGFGLHKRSIEHMLWSTWAGGALCIQVGSEAVDLLSTATIGALLPSVRSMADATQAVYLQIVPQKAPSIVLGANTTRLDGDTRHVEEGLLTLDWKDVDLHMFAYLQDRYVRLFTLRTDLFLPVAIVPDGAGEIIPVLGDISNALKNVRSMGEPLVAEDTQTIIDLIPTLMGFALPALSDALDTSFELPEFYGYRVHVGPQDITAVDNNTFIALFADLVRAASSYTRPVSALVASTRVELDRRTPSGLVRPRVVLDVLGLSDMPVGADALEFSYRVNGGSWSLFQPTGHLTIDDPTLMLQGTHRIELRARYRGDENSAQPIPTEVEVVVDYEAPTLSIERGAGAEAAVLTFVGEDTAHPADALEYRFRIHDGEAAREWSAWSRENTVDLGALALPELVRVEAEVRDGAGLVGRSERTVRRAALEVALDALGSNVDDGAAAGCGCASTGGRGPADGLVWIAAFGLVFAVRRRKALAASGLFGSRALTACLLAIALLALTACGDDTANQKKDDTPSCSPDCLPGFECTDSGQCMPKSCVEHDDCGADGVCRGGECAAGCREDSQCAADCGAGQYGVCQDGECACNDYCAGGCGDNQFCCESSDSCKNYPDPCAGKVCDTGFKPEATHIGDADPNTCQVSGATCECVSLPPLPMGWYGAYSSIATNGSVTAISTHNRTYRDLMVGIVNNGNQVDWHWVDGVPAEGNITGALDGPRGGMFARGPRVGAYSALVVDADSRLHIFYREVETTGLKYARGTRTGADYAYEFKYLDTEGDSAYWNSAVLVDGTIHLVYSNRDLDGRTELRHLSFAADTPFDDVAPEPQVIYSAAQPAAESGPESFPRATGLFAQLTATPDDGLLVVFYDHIRENVAWVTGDGQDWEMPQFLGIASGPYASGAIDASGKLHLAYQDPTLPALVYWSPGMAASEVIADGTRDSSVGWLVAPIGESVKLRLLGEERVHVIYQDATRHMLLGATRANGAWTPSQIGLPGNPYSGGHGFYATALSQASGSLAVEFVINNRVDPPEAYPVVHSLP